MGAGKHSTGARELKGNEEKTTFRHTINSYKENGKTHVDSVKENYQQTDKIMNHLVQDTMDTISSDKIFMDAIVA